MGISPIPTFPLGGAATATPSTTANPSTTESGTTTTNTTATTDTTTTTTSATTNPQQATQPSGDVFSQFMARMVNQFIFIKIHFSDT